MVVIRQKLDNFEHVDLMDKRTWQMYQCNYTERTLKFPGS